MRDPGSLSRAAVPRGIGEARLPDFLGLERGGEPDLLGQDELRTSVLENAFKEQIAQRASEDVWLGSRQSRLSWPRSRVGQHLFAVNVLSNCGQRWSSAG